MTLHLSFFLSCWFDYYKNVVPYLRGIDTSNCLAKQFLILILQFVVPYLRGIDTFSFDRVTIALMRVVPYLRGIDTFINIIFDAKSGCTVPKRNWHVWGHLYHLLREVLHVVSYLRGIDTFNGCLKHFTFSFACKCCTVSKRNWYGVGQS